LIGICPTALAHALADKDHVPSNHRLRRLVDLGCDGCDRRRIEERRHALAAA
jgi:hypothetical protein